MKPGDLIKVKHNSLMWKTIDDEHEWQVTIGDQVGLFITIAQSRLYEDKMVLCLVGEKLGWVLARRVTEVNQ